MMTHVKCSVENCQNKRMAMGLCNMHYLRQRRNGNADARKIAGRGEKLDFISAALDFDGDSCFLWEGKHMAKGYTQVKIAGRQFFMHRYILSKKTGVAYENELEAAHSCGNSLCHNPKHLRWATSAENHADKIAHGTHNRGERNSQSKLTVEQVLLVRSMDLSKRGSLKSVAENFGVHRNTILRAKSGIKWKWLKSEAGAQL